MRVTCEASTPSRLAGSPGRRGLGVGDLPQQRHGGPVQRHSGQGAVADRVPEELGRLAGLFHRMVDGFLAYAVDDETAPATTA